jgi:hypothetical protein
MEAMTQGDAAFEKYVQNKKHEEGSALIQARYQHSMGHHLTLNDIARSESANDAALLSNTVPNPFWIIYHVYSNPNILAACRKELADMVTTSNTGGTELTNTIDMSRVGTACPILLAIYPEVLRFYSRAVSA